MQTLYLDVIADSSNNFFVNVETLVILFIYRLAESDCISLSVKILSKSLSDTPVINIKFDNINFEVVSSISEVVSYCKWPVIVNEHHVTAGLCSVARQLVKNANRKDIKDLLGFREACLMACAESSVWTRFCEIDMITIAKKILSDDFENFDTLTVPQEILRFEFHMSQPVKMHNVYKIARERNKYSIIDTKTPKENLNINHDFSEGLKMTLADIVLYPTFKIFFQKYPLIAVQEKLPLTFKWYEKLEQIFEEKIEFEILLGNTPKHIFVPDFPKRSLYIGDTPNHRTEKGVFTKQADIENALKIVSCLKNEIFNEKLPFGYDTLFTWNDIPSEANPTGGALPQKRAARKCEQLENLVKAVVKLAFKKQYQIVDFCSGSGHLGILLAISLPECQIILVENKERSLERAQERISALNLTNVSIVQSNLDYFHGNFDVGVALHACGVATDLVIRACIEKRAHFVSCPCCYGGIKNCHQVTYPLSEKFQNLSANGKFYLILAHAADQTHDVDNSKTKQGFLCMDVIDTDRRLYAKSCGYDVYLGKLQPISCTNKNNLLVGVYRNKF